MADSGVQFSMSDAGLVTDTDLLCPTTDAEQEVSVQDLPKKPLTLPKEEKKEDQEEVQKEEAVAEEPMPDKKDDKKSPSSEEEDDKKLPSAEEEEEKDKDGDEDVGSDEQELVKKVMGMSVAWGRFRS